MGETLKSQRQCRNTLHNQNLTASDVFSVDETECPLIMLVLSAIVELGTDQESRICVSLLLADVKLLMASP